jgi:outer membrane protein TolC
MSTLRWCVAAPLLAALTLAAAGASGRPTLTLEQVLAHRLPQPGELETAARLATATRQLAAGSGLLPRDATLSVVAGPRSGGESGGSSDLALGIDVPLPAAGAERRALAASLERAAPVLTQASRVEAELAVELAFLDAWRDAEALALREQELTLVETWLAAVRHQVAAGVEPPFRLTVATGERERVTAAREAAAARALASRLALGRLSPLPDGELRLTPPAAAAGALGASPAGNPRAGLADDVASGSTPPGDRAETNLLQRASALRAELEGALAALAARMDRSRFALTGELAREGDEEVARVGLAYRLAPSREHHDLARELAATQETLDRRAALEAAAYAARAAAARHTLAAAPPDLDEAQIERALAAVAALVTEGKVRPTEVLAERRTLLDARLTLLDRRHARAVAAAELGALTRRFTP